MQKRKQQRKLNKQIFSLSWYFKTKEQRKRKKRKKTQEKKKEKEKKEGINFFFNFVAQKKTVNKKKTFF